MAALQRKDYPAAAKAFQGVLSGHASERVILDRARVYLDLAERELKRRPANPQTIEERLTAATLALNNGDERGAERLARSVLDEDTSQDLAAYLLAALEARRGHLDEAMARLTDAVGLNPDIRAQARHDDDFAALRDRAEFQALMEVPAGTLLPRRRPRPTR